jgi:hypothetical protein
LSAANSWASLQNRNDFLKKHLKMNNTHFTAITFIIVLLLGASCFWGEKNNIPFYSYDLLHRNNTKIAAKKIKLAYDVFIDSVRTDFKNKVRFYRVPLDTTIGITHISPGNEARYLGETFDIESRAAGVRLAPELRNDTFIIANNYFCAQEILNDTLFTAPHIAEAFVLEENGKKYLLLNTVNDDLRYVFFCQSLLFDISNDKKIVPIKSTFCNSIFSSKQPNYIGDFNQDGKIDFCFLCQDPNIIEKNLEINVYNIHNNSFVLLDNYHLTLKQVADTLSAYYIDASKSKWFYPLSNFFNYYSNETREFEVYFDSTAYYNYPNGQTY